MARKKISKGSSPSTQYKSAKVDVSIDSVSERDEFQEDEKTGAFNKDQFEHLSQPLLSPHGSEVHARQSILDYIHLDETPRKKSKVPLVSTIILDPVARYQIYGTFPWKMLIHICLVLISSGYAFQQQNVDQTILNP